MDDFRRVADAVAAEIAAGRLRPGERLPPQRRFARDRGIAASTAARVYRELALRGLVTGEVGRGTFVRSGPPPGGGPALLEPSGAPIDLELTYPEADGQAERLAAGLARLGRPDVLAAALRPVGPSGTPAARREAAGLLGTGDPEGVLFAANGRQAIAGAVAALVPPGGRLGVEPLTYPVVKGLLARIGVVAVPIAKDEHGPRPDALAEAHRRAPLKALYLQPTLHNPTGLTVPPQRRTALAEAVTELDLPLVEDRIWSFLADEAPLASLAPERTILVDSLSKRVSPGLSVGFLAVPGPLRGRVAAALRAGAWLPTGYALEAATGWLADGTVAALSRAKRQDAAARRALALEHLAGFAVSAAPRAYFCWWELPSPWRAEAFAGAAAQLGITVTPGAVFATAPEATPAAVRLGLASPAPADLVRALDALADLARQGPAR
ncbi:aminotransferase-like domain-containing protein [Actinomadura rupiterrae]|uniref:aminotransferase-like domain-containing protein n=1 Tax=Actinomadura rupiterrae TaxID=559627 RepID=UPI0020A2D8F0|nr:PLP-dependent aminotransferase family protein [Actinomadura rupiterrae]MCP2341788.1 DNA-binding transcriptional MocR family regulator [Actinomadura rupiterrae]